MSWCNNFYANDEPVVKILGELREKVTKFLEDKLDHVYGTVEPLVPKECIINVMVNAGYDVFLLEYVDLHGDPAYHIIYRVMPFKVCEFYHFIGTEGVQKKTVYSCYKMV